MVRSSVVVRLPVIVPVPFETVSTDKVTRLFRSLETLIKWKENLINLEILELSKNWRTNLTVIKAICKFKRGLKKSKSIEKNNV